MTEHELQREYEEVRQELAEARNKLVTIRQTYEELEGITNMIRGLQSA